MIIALLSEKNNKYEYFIGDEIIPAEGSWVMEQYKFTFSSLGKAFEKPTKTIKD